MTNSIHITNAKGRDATVGVAPLKAPPGPRLGVPGETVVFRRYLAAVEAGRHDTLKARFGADYAKALIDGDPEVDIEQVGKLVEHSQAVFIDSDNAVMYVEPSFIEVILSPDGSEKERRAPADTVANVNTDVPVRWTGRKIPLKDAARRFSFRRSIQLQHVDGLTFDFLYEMAKDLEASEAVMLLGTGEKGGGPLIFQANGRPYRAFLAGRTKDKAYRLTLHLSDMELKKPYMPGERGERGE